MTTFVRPPPLDPWEPGVRAVDVPIAEGGGPNPLEDDSINGFETPPLVPNKTDIAKHLYALFTPAFVQPYPDSWIEIAYGDPAVDEGKPNEAKNFSPFKLEQAIAFAVEKNRAGFNIYVGAALRHGEQSYSGRASGHHVLAASHAWTEYEKAGDDERIAAILKDKDLIPAIVLTTGTVPNPRRHLYFRIDGSATPAEVKAANESLKKLLGTDAVQNSDRVLRLAGTVSYPPEKKKERGYITELVTLHLNRDARAYSLDELIGVAPDGSRPHGYNETEEKPASTVESFFKDVNALAIVRVSHWVKPLFGNLVKFYSSTGCWRTIPEANKILPGRAHLEEAISISQRGVYDYGFEKPSDPISLVMDYGPRSPITGEPTAKDAAFWLCDRMNIAPEILGWGTKERRSASDAGYENGYNPNEFENAGTQSAAGTADGGKSDGSIQSKPASAYTMRAITWFWPDRFAMGKLALIGGLPDKGKGLISSFLMAACTGAEPLDLPCKEGRTPKGRAIWFSAEDDIEDTVVPRLVAAGADLDKVEIMGMTKHPGGERMFNLATDLELLKKKIEELGDVVLLIIDPVSAYLGVGKVNNSSTTDVRAVLAPLTRLAEEKKICVVGVMHFNKKADVTDAMLRIADSLAYVAAARHVYVVVDDPEDEKARLFVKAKNNLAPDQHALRYRVGMRKVGNDPDTKEEIWAPYVEWGANHVEITATEAMEGASSKGSAKQEAEEFLRSQLANGPVPQSEIEDAAKAHGISITGALRRARQQLGVIPRKEKGKANGAWTWELPQTTQGEHRRG